jgi:thiamine pyrophosphokinase
VAHEVIVLAGGDPLGGRILGRLVPNLPAGATVIAADSGLVHAAVLGIAADLVVGDLDSVDPDLLAHARAAGAEVERHPEVKDETDLALALDTALRHAPARVTVIGGHGGRLDHLLANALLLAAPAYADLAIVAHLDDATVTVVRDEARLWGRRGELVTLLPAHGAALGVTTHGLLYALEGDDLAPGSTRGVSNELVGGEAIVTVRSGTLLAVQPGHLGTHVLDPPGAHDATP